MKRKIIKVINIMVIILLLTSTFPLHLIKAETEGSGGGVGDTSGGNSASDMTRSMITYFQDRTNLQVDRVNRDELFVYGVFLSNFFVPWHTRLSDLVNDEGEDSLPKMVSTRFFGSTEKSGQIAEINGKLHESISQVMGFDPETFTMYDDDQGKTPLTGELFYKKMAELDDNNKKIYGGNNQILLDLSDEGTKAVLKVLFGFSPEFMISHDKGLRTLDRMYMDGLGNIWGAQDGMDVQDYILVLPSALNPVVFSKTTKPTKFPMANVFVMGGVLKLTQDSLKGVKEMTPYYNIKDRIPESSTGVGVYNNKNLVTIFGVQSPMEHIGNSNQIIMGANTTNPIERVKSFINEDATTIKSVASMNILVSLDMERVPNLSKMMSENNNLTVEERSNLMNYLFRTSTFKGTQISDYMYYFNIPHAQSYNTSDGEQGNFGTVEDMIIEQKMFIREHKSENGGVGGYSFYSASYMDSPFNKLLDEFYSTNGDNSVLINSELGSLSEAESGDKDFEALKKFLMDGEFGVSDASSVTDALELLKKDNALAYGIVEPSTDAQRITKYKLGFEWVYHLFDTTAFGTAEGDSYIAEMSVAALDRNLFDNFLGIFGLETNTSGRSYIGATTYEPFRVSATGGSINRATQKDQHAIARYFHNFYTYRIFTMNNTFLRDLTGVEAEGGKYETHWGEMTNRTAVMNSVNNYPGIYWGYMREMLNIKAAADGQSWINPTPYSNGHLPPMEIIGVMGSTLDLNEIFGIGGVVASEDRTLEEMQKDIIRKVYGLLSDGPSEYRDNLIKSAVDSWIISTHRAITGSWVGNVLSVSAGGHNTYASVVGYINTPSLTDLPLTDWVLKDYMYIYLFLMLIVFIVLVLLVLTHTRAFREGVLIFILMAFVLILPQFLVSNVINISNSAGDKIYSGRFDYWAITQHQQALTATAGARGTGDEMDYIIQRSMDNANNVYSSDVGVRLKWMSPKKDDVFDSFFNERTAGNALMANLTIFRWLFNSYFNQEEYVYDDPLATYVYRPYNALATYAFESYNELRSTELKREDVADKINNHKAGVFETDLPEYRFALLSDPDGKIPYSEETRALIEEAKPFASGDREKAEIYRYWLLNNEELHESIFRSNYSLNPGFDGNMHDPFYKAYSYSTESPFYYFYNVLKHRYAGVEEYSDFKSALLSREMFKVTSEDPKINNKMRDFLDLEGLFTYVIPYLHQGNQHVYGWTNINGKDISGFDFKEGIAPLEEEDKYLFEKYQAEKSKKEDLKYVWKLYTPWVDQIYNLGVYNERIYVADKRKYIAESVNPGAYEEAGRSMIFSEADMHAKSYRVSDLSDIERRIQATLESTYTDMMYLTNYIDFDDEALITAAAMMATFNFNREFSQPKLVGESVMLYPQNFELKNFNYDAFMRLTLMNATGEPLLADKDLYARVMDKTSVFTGIALIINDILAVILIPTAKMVVLLLLLFLSIIIAISCVASPPERITRTILRNLGLPSLLFLVASITFAFVISLFMGEGLTGYVGGRTPSAGVTDPTIMLGLMIVVDCVYLYVLWRIIKLMLNSLKTHASKSFFTTMALGAVVGSSLVNGAMNFARGSMDRRLGKKQHKETIEALKQSGGAGGTQPTQDPSASDSGYGDPGITRPVSDDVNPINSKDPSLRDDIDAKASRMAQPSDGSFRKRTLGHRLIDFKYNVRGKVRDVQDGLGEAQHRARETYNYATSSDGLRRDVVEQGRQVRDKAHDSVLEGRGKVNSYIKDLRAYESSKLQEDLRSRARNARQTPSTTRRQQQDYERLNNLNQKVEAREKRAAILESKKRSKK